MFRKCSSEKMSADSVWLPRSTSCLASEEAREEAEEEAEEEEAKALAMGVAVLLTTEPVLAAEPELELEPMPELLLLLLLLVLPTLLAALLVRDCATATWPTEGAA